MAYLLVDRSPVAADFHCITVVALVRGHELDPAVAVQLEQGQVWFPRSAPWLQGFLDELLAFPSGAHDDQVDSATQALNYCAGTGPMRESTAIYGRASGVQDPGPFPPLSDEDWQRRSQLDTAQKAASKGALGFRGVRRSQ